LGFSITQPFRHIDIAIEKLAIGSTDDLSDLIPPGSRREADRSAEALASAESLG